jgi:hypothetical protein
LAHHLRRLAARLLLFGGVCALLPACSSSTDFGHVAVNIPPNVPKGPSCEPVACPDNNTTSTCPGSTHCFNGFCIDSSCQQICVQSDGTQSVVPDDAGQGMVKPCQVVSCGSGFCAGATAACCSGACTDTNTDSNNCGSCGVKCTAPSTCSGGVCNCGGNSCFSWESCCSNTCIDPNWDNNNCGGCGLPCGNGKVCDFATCIQGCYIAGVTYWPGTWDPAGSCGTCSPLGSGGTVNWSPGVDGQYCSVSGGDVCVGGSCKTGCLVSSLPNGTFQPPTLEATGWVTNGCFSCQPLSWPDGVLFDPSQGPACTDPPDYPFPSENIAGGVGGDGRFWVTGGWNYSGPGGSYFVSNQSWGLDPNPNVNNWVQGPNMILARRDAAGAAADGQIFVFGGLDSTNTTLANAEVFNPPANPWVAITPLSTPRHLGVAVYVPSLDTIYIMGGEESVNGTPVDTVETYQGSAPYTQAVLAAPSTVNLIPVNLGLTGPTGQPVMIGSSAIVDDLNQLIYVIGGYYPYAGPIHSSVWVYDIVNNSWDWAPSLAVAQAQAGTTLDTTTSTIYEVTGDIGFDLGSTEFQTASITGLPLWSTNPIIPYYPRLGAMAFYNQVFTNPPGPDDRVYVIGGEAWGWYWVPTVEVYVLNSGYDVWIPY